LRESGARVKRARIQYFATLTLALGLFAVAATLTFAPVCGETPCLLLRFLVLMAAIASAVATWGTAVMIAFVHKVAWPLWLTVSLVVLAAASFAAVAAS
jgi:hypothetical protein